MAYSSISIKQFRSYRDARFALAPGVNIIVGPNGSGKTNLLEALYVLSQGSSFRVNDKDLIEYGQNQFKLTAENGQQLRALTYEINGTPAKKFKIDGAERQRLSHQQKVPLVLFEPEDLRLLSGSPARRRDYLDSLIGRLWPEAGVSRSRFERALMQRNNIIKQAASQRLPSLDDQFFVWDIKLAEYASALVAGRLKLLEGWNGRLSAVYSRIAGEPSTVSVSYKTDCDVHNYKASLLHRLLSSRERDIARGFTSVGPHRDDFVVSLNGVEAAVTASRGENRSLVLALKIIELELLESMSREKPLLLLDDVFSELDIDRRLALSSLTADHQTVITTTDVDSIAENFTHSPLIIDLQKSLS